MHSFANPAANDLTTNTVDDETDNRRLWQAMTQFFEELFDGL
jgi:hypothetical protein